MPRSLALALYLMAAARPAPGPLPSRPPRPDGTLLWIVADRGRAARDVADRGTTHARIMQLVQRLRILRPSLHILISGEDLPPEAGALPPRCHGEALPPDRLPQIRSFLGHWAPDLIVLLGRGLPPALIVEAHDQGVPMILADVHLPASAVNDGHWRRGMAGSLLTRFIRLLPQDAASAARLQALGGRLLLPVEVVGRIEETADPLPASEAERAGLAHLLQARPVWLAVDCPVAEEEAVLAAHARVLRLAHRMLLIIVPESSARAAAIEARCTALGLAVALRSREEEPDPEIQVFIADAEGEHGLWYRLAPVTYMGGTLSNAGRGRSPFEPAALGSAIIHGPFRQGYPEIYARLDDARAARPIGEPGALADALTDLIAPDRTALLAHNAWAVSSGGAEVTERVAEIILATLGGGGPGGAPAKAAV